MKHLLPSVLLLVTATAGIHSQQLATLNVAVRDPAGRAVNGANVTISSAEMGITRSQQTDSAGAAVLNALLAGDYRFTVEAGGFNRFDRPLNLTIGQVASIDVHLGVAAVKESVNVDETPAGSIDLETPESSKVIPTRQIADLPIIDRDFIDFVLLTPTANVGRSTATGAQSPFQESVLQLSFAGLRETHTTFFGLDGTDYSVSLSGVQHVSPSLDWVQEFRVIDGPYRADNGRNLGSVVETITKSGMNIWHGTVYDYFRNDAVNAQNPLSVPGLHTLRVNQFGFNTGGHIRRDKAFFFTGYEGQRRAESPIYSSFILGCTNSPNCMGPGTPSINQVKASFGLQPEILGSILETDNYDKVIGKITQVLSESNVLNIGYLIANDRKGNIPSAAPGEGLPSTYRDNPVRDQTVYANYLHLFNPKWSSESILDFGDRLYRMKPRGAGFEPTLNVSDTFVSGGFTGSVAYYREPHFEARENVGWTHRSHSIKFGGGFEPVWIAADTTFFSPGGAIFTPQSFFGAGPFAGPPFGIGTPVEFLFLEPRSYFGKQIPPHQLPFGGSLYAGSAASDFEDATRLHFWHRLIDFYIQDQWKLTPNLSVTTGIRYDVDLFPSAKDVRIIGPIHPTNYENLQPRVGIAYSMHGGKQVARAGFGLFRGPWDYSDALPSWQGASAFTSMNNPLVPEFNSPGGTVGFGQAGVVGVTGPILASQAFRRFTSTGAYPAPNDLKQFPLGYTRRKFPNELAEHASLEVESVLGRGWVLNVEYKFLHAMDLLVYNSVNGLPNGTLPDGRQSFTTADPRFGFVLLATPSGFSIYHGGVLSLRHDFTHHYSLVANYNYSKSIDISTNVQLTETPQNYLNPAADRSVGDNDIRHRVTMHFLAESPSQWPTPLRNFKFSMLNTLQSPRYYSILAGFNVLGDGFPFSDRTGTVGRNSYRGASYYDTDLRLQRNFQLQKGLSTEISIEGFNILNHLNVQSIDQVYGAADFLGPVPHQFGDGIASPANANFARPNFTGPSRQLQGSVRISF